MVAVAPSRDKQSPPERGIPAHCQTQTSFLFCPLFCSLLTSVLLRTPRAMRSDPPPPLGV